MESIFLVTAVAGSVELVKKLYDGDLRTASIIFIAAFVGACVGLAGIDGVTVIEGIGYGLSASGALKIAREVGKR